MSIRIRRLRLIGINEDYLVDFCDEDGPPRSLSIIAGEISTGKTAVLEFIDYCLGQNHHPGYVEIERQARSAQLELDLGDRTCVIERPLFGDKTDAWLHDCSLSELDKPHPTRKVPVDPASNSKSLNWLLLANSGLEGVVLKEAPTKASSGTDPLSFRDVMWLAFLHSDRLAKRHLLHESGAPMKRLKLKQLIEVIFGIHDQELTAIAARIRLLEQERTDQQAEIAALETFLKEQEVVDEPEARTALEQARLELEPLEEKLEAVTSQMRAASDFADSVRERYSRLRRQAGAVSARVRDRESLLRRLLPLRAQYAEDERKLVFFSEAQQLLDPMAVKVCPSCLTKLSEEPGIEAGKCTLCASVVEQSEEPIDVEAERAAIRARLRAINQYVEVVEGEIASQRGRYDKVSAEESAAQAQLDSDLSEQLAPFVAERDELVGQIASKRAQIGDLERQLGWLEGVARRSSELATVQVRIEELRAEAKELEGERPSRDAVVSDLTVRFRDVLADFGFPKLEDPEPPYLDNDFVPHVRGRRYDQIGSPGAVTLVADAWELAIFERAIELGRPHPGFLMIDSPQTNLKPTEGQPKDEFTEPEIGERLWAHIAKWSEERGSEAQLIVVDHRPPAAVEDNIVVTFSGNPDHPPYGLISNETEGEGVAD
jgi:hypothetical protein